LTRSFSHTIDIDLDAVIYTNLLKR
jgi:hypothetical protein